MDDLHQAVAKVTQIGYEVASLLRASDMLLNKTCAEIQTMAGHGSHDRPDDLLPSRIAAVTGQLTASIELGRVASVSAIAARRDLDAAIGRARTSGNPGCPGATLLRTLEQTGCALDMVAAAVEENKAILTIAIEQLQTRTQDCAPTREVIAITHDLLHRLASAGRKWPV